ncbi:MAG: DUF4410 domain-containing protein [Salinisphaera sp.]|uniref:DUF4410 domain-containing protein n=1 Tax=Salinisphaera sp. TaxID=1914330 RepID=UPI003C7D19AF
MKMKLMTVLSVALLGLVAAALFTGCASTKVSNRQQLANGQLPKPSNILVYDFAATASDVPSDSTLAGADLNAIPQTPEQIAEGRKLGHEIATDLVKEIRAMGMPAQQASPQMQPQLNDVVIRGYLLSVKEGSAAKRVAIGFGAGASELRTAVEGFQMTAQGLRKLGSGNVDTGGSKSPGAALGAATLLATANPAGLIISSGMKVYGEASGSSKVEGRAKATAKEIAKVLKQRFQEQGWIN